MMICEDQHRCEDKIVLVAVDCSDHSMRAFNWYLENFHRRDRVIGLAHVYTLPKHLTVGRHHRESLGAVECKQHDDDVKEVTDDHTALIKKYQDICVEKGLRSREFCMEKQCSIGETICEIAKENNVCCIVMGQRGLGAIKRKLYGSVSEYVLHNAQTTVVVVPPEKK